MSSISILRAARDPKLFEPWFKDPASWAAWFGFLKALFALPMAEADLAIYTSALAGSSRRLGPQSKPG
jgi:hypothetical protein